MDGFPLVVSPVLGKPETEQHSDSGFQHEPCSSVITADAALATVPGFALRAQS